MPADIFGVPLKQAFMIMAFLSVPIILRVAPHDEGAAAFLSVGISLISVMFVGKFGWSWVTIAFGVIVGILMYGIVFLDLFIGIRDAIDANSFNGSVVQQSPQPAPFQHPLIPPQEQATRESIMWHGTSAEAAWDIFRHNRFLVNNDLSLWITEDFDYAKGIADNNGNGLIVALFVDPGIDLIHQGGYNWTAPVPSGERGKYYRFEGIVPAGVYDSNGNQIA